MAMVNRFRGVVGLGYGILGALALGASIGALEAPALADEGATMSFPVPAAVVAVEELEKNPQAYDGTRVQVTAEPVLGAEMCTMRACLPAVNEEPRGRGTGNEEPRGRGTGNEEPRGRGTGNEEPRGRGTLCCNRCAARYLLKNEATQGADIILASNGKLTLGCGGDECTWRASCTPFGEGGGHYNFTGVFRVNAFGEKQLIVEGFVPATAQQ